MKLGIQPSHAEIVTSDNDTNIVHCLLQFAEGIKLIQVDLSKMKINMISPKSSFAKKEILAGTISAKEVATNKTGIYEDKS